MAPIVFLIIANFCCCKAGSFPQVKPDENKKNRKREEGGNRLNWQENGRKEVTLPPSPSPSPVLYELSDKKEGDSRMKGGRSRQRQRICQKNPCKFCTKSSTNLQKFVSKYYELNGFFLKNGGKFGHNADFPSSHSHWRIRSSKWKKSVKKGRGESAEEVEQV